MLPGQKVETPQAASTGRMLREAGLGSRRANDIHPRISSVAVGVTGPKECTGTKREGAHLPLVAHKALREMVMNFGLALWVWLLVAPVLVVSLLSLRK